METQRRRRRREQLSKSRQKRERRVEHVIVSVEWVASGPEPTVSAQIRPQALAFDISSELVEPKVAAAEKHIFMFVDGFCDGVSCSPHGRHPRFRRKPRKCLRLVIQSLFLLSTYVHNHRVCGHPGRRVLESLGSVGAARRARFKVKPQNGPIRRRLFLWRVRKGSIYFLASTLSIHLLVSTLTLPRPRP